MQQEFLARFVCGQLFYKDIPGNKSGHDNVPTYDAQVELDLEIGVNVSTSIL